MATTPVFDDGLTSDDPGNTTEPTGYAERTKTAATAPGLSGAVATFAELVPEQWPAIRPHVMSARTNSSDPVVAQLSWARRNLDLFAMIPLADLEALTAGWTHYRHHQRALLAGVVDFLTTARHGKSGGTVRPLVASTDCPALATAQIDRIVVATVHAVMGAR